MTSLNQEHGSFIKADANLPQAQQITSNNQIGDRVTSQNQKPSQENQLKETHFETLPPLAIGLADNSHYSGEQQSRQQLLAEELSKLESKKSTQLIDDILATASEVHRQADKNAELQTITPTQSFYKKDVQQSYSKVGDHATKLVDDRQYHQSQVLNSNNSYSQQYDSQNKAKQLAHFNQLQQHPYYQADLTNLQTIKVNGLANSFLDNFKQSRYQKFSNQQQVSRAQKTFSTKQQLHMQDPAYVSRSKLHKSKDQVRSVMNTTGTNGKSAFRDRSSVSQSRLLEHTHNSASVLSKSKQTDQTDPLKDLEVLGIQPPKNKVLQAVIKVARQPVHNQDAQDYNMLIQQSNKTNGLSMHTLEQTSSQNGQKRNENKQLQSINLALKQVKHLDIQHEPSQQQILSSSRVYQNQKQDSSQASSTLTGSNRIGDHIYRHPKQHSLKQLNLAFAGGPFKNNSRNQTVHNYKSLPEHSVYYSEMPPKDEKQQQMGGWQPEGPNHMDSLSLLDRQPWQVTKSLFGNSKKAKNVLNEINTRHRSVQSKAELFDSIIGQDQVSTGMPSGLVANMSAREKSKYLDQLLDEEAQCAPDISDLFKMTKINFTQNSFKKKLAFPVDNQTRRNKLKQRNLNGVSQWSLEKRSSKIELRDMKNNMQVNQKQQLQMKQLINLIGSRMNPKQNYVNRSCNQRLNQTQNMFCSKQSLLGQSQANKQDSVFYNQMDEKIKSNRSSSKPAELNLPKMGQDSLHGEAGQCHQLNQNDVLEQGNDGTSSNAYKLSQAFEQLNNASSLDSLDQYNQLYQSDGISDSKRSN